MGLADVKVTSRSWSRNARKRVLCSCCGNVMTPSQASWTGGGYCCEDPDYQVACDSRLEAERLAQLVQRQINGAISALEFHPVLELVIGTGVAGHYTPDATYSDATYSDGHHRPVVFEAKGYKSDVFKLRWRVAQCCYPDRVFVLATNEVWEIWQQGKKQR